jgi:1,4-alpha-glucan branching enzyme
MSSERGELALVLHSHMPYVEGFGTWPFGEEWLWEALAGVYLPLLDAIREAPVTLGVTPVLCDQLETLTGEAGERFTRFLREIRAPVHAEDVRGLEDAGEYELAAEVRRAAADYSEADRAFAETGGDVIGAVRDLAERGAVELWSSAATHCLLPLVATDAVIRLQLETGIAAHERRYGTFGGGFWLPECAYRPGLEHHLAEHGVRAFCVDQTAALGLGSLDNLEPVMTAAGVVAVPVDWQTVQLAWSESAYAGNPVYRDYHARTVHDLKPWNNGGGPYRHFEALALARRHARDFVARTIARLDAYGAERGRPGLVCCALDTELLGHWWYEGLPWLRYVVDEARLQGLALATLPAALERHEAVERELEPSSWGRPKDLSTWDSPAVAEIAFAARRGELRTVALAAGAPPDHPALARAARELLALQSSDWAFQVTHALAGDYPLERVRGHAEALDAALDALTDSGAVGEPTLRHLAPELSVSALVAD